MSRLSIAEPSAAANTARARSIRAPPRGRPGKRLVLCEDGSWLNSDSGSLKGSISIDSNVTKISRAIKPVSSDGIPQIVYYHWGVGAGGGIFDKLVGIGGGGLEEIVREGYQFIATNWVPGDEIFIFGFSRGAYTARSIAGLIGEIGVLTNDGIPFLAEIFRDVQRQHDESYRPKHPDIPFPDKPSFLDPEYRVQLRRRKLTVLDVPIKVIGVWDTVGALGFPKLGWLTRLGGQSSAQKDLRFYDTALSDAIEFAFQALALDERRFSFQPTLWEKLPENQTVLRQVWFPGAHANIGGGYDDQQIAVISLAWMISQCQEFLDFDFDYVHEQWEQCEQYYERHRERVRPWGFGKIWSGMQGVYALGGAKVRTPGRYCVVDPTNGRQTAEPLEETHEFIHPSVRARIKLHGPGLEDKGEYICSSLSDWKLVIEQGEDGSKRPNIYWKSRDRPVEGFTRILREAPLWQLETELLEFDHETEQYVLKPSGVRQRKSQRRRSRSRAD